MKFRPGKVVVIRYASPGEGYVPPNPPPPESPQSFTSLLAALPSLLFAYQVFLQAFLLLRRHGSFINDVIGQVCQFLSSLRVCMLVFILGLILMKLWGMATLDLAKTKN